MSQLQDRIAQFRKMATDDPDNELGHFRLGQLLADDGQPAEAAKSFARTLELSPQFSKVYQLLAECHVKLNDNEKAVEALTTGYKIADERGDKMPRDAMAKMLTELGAPIPKIEAAAAVDEGPDTGFRCERPGCAAGRRARQLPKPPVPDAIGQEIYAKICADCWTGWFKDYSIKVINELRLDLSSEFGQAEYDKYMREYLGFEA
ncbi:Fe(2+)-trafficking protein [Limnoglobus roseus]|uniref:Tetratricopeptide repeat protein n=1 Tax=Limnoglobus roseus TaxID=2598579 RepID=A0A5C1A540_9BACT|nr:Fe(2+)-trafficking protein [Limnoglobus roseus]QEL14239.1 tetratricopeptide repeat protein [Limnoglobus roseus]